jgi:hypothetical protein
VGDEHYGVIINAGLENTGTGNRRGLQRSTPERADAQSDRPVAEEDRRGARPRVKSGGHWDLSHGARFGWRQDGEMERKKSRAHRNDREWSLSCSGPDFGCGAVVERQETWEMTTVSGRSGHSPGEQMSSGAEGGERYGFYFSAISASPYEAIQSNGEW